MKKIIEKLKKYVKKLDNQVTEYSKKIVTMANPSKSYVDWAMKLMDEGKEDIAIEKLKTAAQMAIPNPDACVSLAMAYLKRNELDDIPNLLNKAIKIDSQYARAYMVYGIYYSMIKDYKNAEKYHEQAAKLDPRLPDVFVNWAVSLVSQGKKNAAQEKFKKAIFYNPNNVAGLYLWAILDIEMDMYSIAIDKLKDVLSFQPNNSDAAYYIAFAYYKDKKYNSAIEFAKLSIASNPENVKAYNVLCDSLSLTKNYSKALEIYKKVDSGELKNETFYISWGHNAFCNHDFKNSEYAYRKAHNINNNSVQAKMGLAVNLILVEKYDEARELLIQAKNLSPDNSDIYINLSNIENVSENYKLAIEYMEQAIKLDVKNTKFYFQLAQLYEKNNDIKKAKDTYSKMLEYDKSNPLVYYHYAKLFIDDNSKEALRKIRTAYNLDNDNYDFLKLYAILLFKNEQLQNALSMIEKCIDKNADDYENLYIKCEILLNLRRFDEVIKLLYDLPQDKKENEKFDYLLLWAYILRTKKTQEQFYINEMNDFSYYLSQKYSKNNDFMVKLKKLKEIEI